MPLRLVEPAKALCLPRSNFQGLNLPDCHCCVIWSFGAIHSMMLGEFAPVGGLRGLDPDEGRQALKRRLSPD